MWPRQCHIMDPLTEASSGPIDRKIFWDDALGDSFKELKCVISADTLFSYQDYTIPFTVNTDAYGK